MFMKLNSKRLFSFVGLLAIVFANELATAATIGTGGKLQGLVGLQVYSLRDQFKRDVPGTLDEVKRFGFEYAELDGTYKLPTGNITRRCWQRAASRALACTFLSSGCATTPKASHTRPRRLALNTSGVLGYPTKAHSQKKPVAQRLPFSIKRGK